MNVITMQDVSKRYGNLEALSSLDLSVEAGEVVSILGPNGAGKSTAIQLMLGLRRASDGEVRLFGHDPQSPAARERVGAMLQETGVPETLTVAELLRLYGSYYPYHLPLGELLERANLQDKRDEQLRKLSGGQKQRLYFALAIAGDPDLIFLDEPTAAMDAHARRAFWTQVREFASLGKTVLFSTHYLQEADEIANRIVVIHQGRLLTQGSPQAIKRLVAAKTIRLKTDAPLEKVLRLPEVQRAEVQNGQLTVYSNQPEAVLKALFREGHEVRDLTVSDTDLEAAFVSLTKEVSA